ncbi:MAG: cohesin domain-containing protein [Bacteroidales bacterium]|nr:cohesin domain-containing protein [Bacteroidales bacterium]
MPSGDINASYNPSYGGFKAAPELQYEDVMLAEVGEEITLPISIDQFESLGAISLDLNYRNNLIDVVGVTTGEDFAKVDEENGTIRINWFDIETKDFNKDAAIAQITVKVKQAFDKQTRLFELNDAELANGNAEVIDGVNLKSLSVSTAADDMSGTAITSTNSPNPFKETTNIQFNLPESGKVQIVLYDMMGSVVDNILEENMKAGQHDVELKANNLNQGVYQYRIILQGEKRDYSVIRSIVVM